MPSVFADNNCFPVVEEGGIVKVLPLLDATDEAIEILKHLGTVYAPARNDISQNVKVLREFYQTDSEAHNTFQDIVNKELQNTGDHRVQHIMSLLWLKRGLEFIGLLLHHIIKEHGEGSTSDSLRSCCMAAYENSLKPYHGFIASSLFSVMSRCLPYKSTFLNLLKGDEEDIALVIGNMKIYVAKLQENTSALHKLLEENQLNFPDVV